MDATACEPATNPTVAVERLIKRYGDVEALGGVSFATRPAEVLGLIGPNGAGKTTLLECLCGLQVADAGEVSCRGHRLSPRQRRAVMFYVPEHVVPYPRQSVRQVLSFFADVYHRSEEVPRIVESLSLSSVLRQRVGRLSKGWRRRLLIAIGLISPQPILLMDEPLDGLDLRQTREVMAILREVAGKGRTLLLSIHQLADAQRVCDRFVLLSAGAVAGEGTLSELQARAAVPGGSLEDVFLALS